MKNSRNDELQKITTGQLDTLDTVKTNDTLSYTYQDLNGEFLLIFMHLIMKPVWLS